MPIGTYKGRAPWFEDADVTAVGSPTGSAGRRAQTRVPDLFKARGVDALLCSFPPLHDLLADVGVRFRWGEKSFVAPPAANLPVVLARFPDLVG